LPDPVQDSTTGDQDRGLLDFQREAPEVLGRVCRAFGQVIENLPGPIRRAADVQRVLGLDKALGWQLFRIGSGADPIEAGPLVPRPAPLAKALKAAARCGVPGPVIAEASEAAEVFEDLVERHAGHRSAFDAMARGLAQGEAEQVQLKDRRAAFRANRNIWGISAQASYSCLIYHASEQPGMQDSVLVAGQLGLQRLRPDARISVGYLWSVHKSEDAARPVGARVTAQQHVDFIEDFSTSPLPVLSVREVEPKVMEATLDLRGVGRAGAVTYFARHTARAASGENTPWWGAIGTCRVPAEVAVHDVMIPRGWSAPSSASAAVYGNLQDPRRAGARDSGDRLPCALTLAHLGQDLARLQNPSIPRCPELVAAVLCGMAWQDATYDLFRCVMEYPILHAGIATRVDAAR
jgi:hypothetical protein